MAKKTVKEYKQGIFKPIHREKCLNKECPVYRSGLELSVMLVLDKSSVVKKWGSEVTVIPYFKEVENRPARYYMDFTIVIDLNGKTETWLVEVKPERQTVEPTKHGNKKSSTILYENMMYITNKNKWEAAEGYAKKHNYKFVLMTEKNIDTLLRSL